MADQTERALIAGTIADLDDAIDDLEMKIGCMQDELDAKRERLIAWKKRLAEIDGTPVEHRGRRPRGENLRMIKSCLDDAVEGLTASEVKGKTGLAWSSVQRVLSQNPDLFYEVNGLWQVRRPKTGATTANGSLKEAEA